MTSHRNGHVNGSNGADLNGPRVRGHGDNGIGDVRAIILAGGRGTRLAPYTSVLPKPLMPIGDRSILELVVDQLTSVGIRDFTFCVGYLSHLIETVFAHRPPATANIAYVHESHPLGTAAPLKLVERPKSTFIVMNGDVLSNIRYADLIEHHRAQANLVTIATYEQAIKIEYGIIHLGDSRRVRALEEKPRIVSNVSMGIYVLEPAVIDQIPDDAPFDFPDLVTRLLDRGERVGSYHHDGLWFDIGNHDDYVAAVEIWEQAQAATRANGTAPSAMRANGTATAGRPSRTEAISRTEANGHAAAARVSHG